MTRSYSDSDAGLLERIEEARALRPRVRPRVGVPLRRQLDVTLTWMGLLLVAVTALWGAFLVADVTRLHDAAAVPPPPATPVPTQACTTLVTVNTGLPPCHYGH